MHNLKSLPDEEFYSIEDNYVLHLDEFTGDITGLLKKHHTVAAGLLILFGISILWRGISDIFYWFLPGPLAGIINNLGYSLPQIIIGAFILIAGIYLLNSKRQSFNQYEDSYTQEEHYWEPYRPYQQQGTPNQHLPDQQLPQKLMFRRNRQHRLLWKNPLLLPRKTQKNIRLIRIPLPKNNKQRAISDTTSRYA